MKKRLAAVAISLGVVLGLTGCGFVTPVATQYDYDASDGVSAVFGAVSVRNILVITEDGENGNLIFTAANSSTEPIELVIEYPADSPAETVVLEIPAQGSVILGANTELERESVEYLEPLLISGLDTQAGALFNMFFQAGDAEGKKVPVPVLGTELEEYRDLAPSEPAAKKK